MSLRGCFVPGRCVRMIVMVIGLVMIMYTAAIGQTATDLPMWYDVASSTPVNTKLNTDATMELQNEEQVAVDPTNPDNLVAVWRDFRLGYRQVGWAYSHNGGDSWTEGGLVSQTPYNRDSDPGIAVNSQGVFFSVILSFDQFSEANGLFVPFSFDSGTTWVSWLDAVNTDFGTFEDKEMITCDVTGGPTDGNLYIPWTRFGDSTGIFCVSAPSGFGFASPVPVSDRGNVQWPVPIVGTDGRLIVAWWSSALSSIMYDISFDAGVTFGTDAVLTTLSSAVDVIAGGITTFPFPALASDVTGGPYDGNLYCAFTDRAADGLLDLYFTISTDGGGSWSPRMRINDDPLGNGVDQFHPWAFVNPDGVLSVTFYDRRLDPNNLNFDLFITHSFDGGQSWTPNQRVTDVSSSPFDAVASASRQDLEPVDPDRPIALSPQAGLIGEYIGLATSRVRATLVYTDTRNGNQDVYAANMPLRLFPPKLTGPDDDLLTNGPSVTFTWEDWSVYDSALTYVLEYSVDTLFSSGVTRYAGLSAQSHSEVLPDGRYFWRVRAFDTFGDSSDVVARSIWVDATPPASPTPIPPSPLTGDTISDPTPLFVWSAVTSAGANTSSPISYNIVVSPDPDCSSVVYSFSGIVDTEFDWPDSNALDFGKYWAWAVGATDAAGNESIRSQYEWFFLQNPYIIGDLNDDGFVDSIDLSLLIDLVFFGGSLPAPPPARADMDCNGVPDAVDVSLLVDLIFFGAPAPSCP